MFKKILIIFFLLLLNNCTVTGNAFLGPIYTGAKTGSLYQSSLSYSSGKMYVKMKNDLFKKGIVDETINLKTVKSDNYSLQPPVLIALNTFKVEISSVIEPEPLP